MEPKPQKVEILTSSINYIKQTYKDVWTHEWKTSSVARKLYEIQQTPSDLEMYKNTNRQIQTFISRARTGHIITEHYLYLFNLTESPLCKRCGTGIETATHTSGMYASPDMQENKGEGAT